MLKQKIVKILKTKTILISCSLIFFILGNLVYSSIVNVPWYIRSIISEGMFVFMYTIVDFGNLKYRYKFAFPHIALLLIFYTPLFLPLFYTQSTQVFSVSISILAILVNSKVLYFLYSKGFKKIFCTRIGTTTASLLEIILFSFLLDLGIKGAILMCILRPIYIAFIPKVIFKSENKVSNII